VSERFNQLSARHQELRLRSAAQRRELAQITGDIEQRLGGVDRTMQTLRSFARNPVVIAGAFAVLAMVGPKRLLGYASRGAVLMSTARQLLASGKQRPTTRQRQTTKSTKITKIGS
jgi:hypothetical protein